MQNPRLRKPQKHLEAKSARGSKVRTQLAKTAKHRAHVKLPIKIEAYIQFANQKGAARQKALGVLGGYYRMLVKRFTSSQTAR